MSLISFKTKKNTMKNEILNFAGKFSRGIRQNGVKFFFSCLFFGIYNLIN